MTNLTINITTIIAEVVLVFIFFFLVNWCFNQLYRQILKIPVIRRFNKQALGIRRNVRGFLLLSSLVLSLVVIGINCYLIYRGENVRDYSFQLIRQVPEELWFSLGSGIIKSIGVVIGTSLVLRILEPLLDKISKYAQNIDSITDNDRSIATFFSALKQNIDGVSWIAITILCAQFLFLPSIVTKYLYILLRSYLIIAIGLLFFKVVAVIIDSLDALSIKYSSPDNLLHFYDKFQDLIPFLKRCLEYIIYVSIATFVIQQINFVADLAIWGPTIIKLISIILLSRILISIAYLLVEQLLLRARKLTESQTKRAKTVIPLIQNIAKYLIYFGAGVLMLETININPAPILAGAGIVGIALSLGSQNLINDIVSGFFILFENYYLVGDYVETDQASGYVEAIELKTTRIRHDDGQVYYLRNGDINLVTNYSREFVYAVVDIGVDYNTNLALVNEVIERVGHRLKAENDNVLEPTQVQGVEEFGEIRLSIHPKTKVKPGKHLQVQRTLRKMLKETFDREGIYIPVGESADKPEWVSKVQKEQNKKYRNIKPQVRRVINESKSTTEIKQLEEKQVRYDQLQEKSSSDKSVAETARMLEQASQQAIVHQPEENLTIHEAVSENQILEESSQQAIIHQSEKNLTIDESAPKTQIQQYQVEKETGKKSKSLKKMLQEFLDTH